MHPSIQIRGKSEECNFSNATYIRVTYLTTISEHTGPRIVDEGAAQTNASFVCCFSQQLPSAALIITHF